MKKRTVLWMLIVMVSGLALLAGCGNNPAIPVEKQGFYMGTVVTAQAYGPQAPKAVEEGLKRIKDLEGKMTVNAPGGEIARLNAAAGNSAYVPLSSDSLCVLKAALKYGQLSRGAFDPTVGPLVKAWGFGQNPRLPAPAEIEGLKELVNYRDLEIDEEKKAARLKKPGQRLDLGGIAKGYAGDEVLKIYQAYGLESGFINLGGNVVVLGGKPDGSPWQVGIRDPGTQDGSTLGVLAVRDKTVVTSGDYERYFEEGGRRYHHILDPQTGYPSQSGLISVTIVSGTSMEADALSTAAFVLGLAEGLKLVESLEGVEAVFITGDRKIYLTPGLKDNFTLTDQGGTYHCYETT